MNPTINLLMAHRSIRKFTNKQIGDALLEKLVAAGQAAASSSFLQGVTIMRITDPDKRQQFVELANNQSYIATAPEFLVFCADLSRPNRCCEITAHQQGASPAIHSRCRPICAECCDRS